MKILTYSQREDKHRGQDFSESSYDNFSWTKYDELHFQHSISWDFHNLEAEGLNIQSLEPLKTVGVATRILNLTKIRIETNPAENLLQVQSLM